MVVNLKVVRDNTNSFEAAHEWEHDAAPSHFKVGERVLAQCTACGTKQVAITESNHGGVDAIVIEGGEPNHCTATGRTSHPLKK